mmetsp:Transcript_103668/g.251706  ORF Transcript_103668/g.251706 Transcript_103668/m.251706 type:complete len:225 (+) Transcript_103668:390-1064(+)
MPGARAARTPRNEVAMLSTLWSSTAFFCNSMRARPCQSHETVDACIWPFLHHMCVTSPGTAIGTRRLPVRMSSAVNTPVMSAAAWLNSARSVSMTVPAGSSVFESDTATSKSWLPVSRERISSVTSSWPLPSGASGTPLMKSKTSRVAVHSDKGLSTRSESNQNCSVRSRNSGSVPPFLATGVCLGMLSFVLMVTVTYGCMDRISLPARRLATSGKPFALVTVT